jgi:hypothetical protein
VKPTIPRGERFWPLTKDESKAIDTLFKDDGGPQARDVAQVAPR